MCKCCGPSFLELPLHGGTGFILVSPYWFWMISEHWIWGGKFGSLEKRVNTIWRSTISQWQHLRWMGRVRIKYISTVFTFADAVSGETLSNPPCFFFLLLLLLLKFVFLFPFLFFLFLLLPSCLLSYAGLELMAINSLLILLSQPTFLCHWDLLLLSPSLGAGIKGVCNQGVSVF